MNNSPRPPRGVAVVAAAAFVLAFAVRFAWVLRVQSPLDAVYSDFGGYVDRAELLLAHKIPADPRVLTIYPPGTHALLALEFLVFGRDARVAIAIVHSLVGAVAAPCMSALTVRIVPSLAASALVGTLVALWAPHVAFSGFFSSEIWFSAAISLHAWLTVHEWRRSAGKLATGVAAATAFVVRPQFLLAWLIELGARGLRLVWRRGLRGALRSLAWLAVPVVITIAVTSVRFRRLSGHWGLVSESAANRLWADTDVCQIRSTWTTPSGETWTYWFSPPSKPGCNPSDSVRFDGYIVDPDIIDRIRRERLRGVSWRQRLVRRLGNIRLLVVGNLPWPESSYREPPWRDTLHRSFAYGLLFGVLPLAALGLVLGRRNRTMLIVAANLAAVIIAAAIFFGEARYNVPYAPFAILLAVVGAHELFRRVSLGLRAGASSRLQAGARANDGPDARARAPELVSFVIPTVREYAFARSLDRLLDHLGALPSFEHEILVVDDSDAETQAELDAEIADRRATLKRGITLRLVPGPRRGKGAAVRAGVQESRGDVVFVVDADLPVPLRHIEEFLDEMRVTGADVVVGERPHNRNAGHRLRHLLSRGLWLIQTIVVFHGRRFEDTQCGFKAFGSSALRRIVERQLVDRGMYDLEYLYAATQQGLKVRRVAVTGDVEVRPSRIDVWRCLLLDPVDILKFKIWGIFGHYT